MRNHCATHIAKLARVIYLRFCCRLLPQNLADITRFPSFVSDHVKQGGFVLNVFGRNCHSQDLDEGHESYINRDVKAALNSCSSMALSKVVSYVRLRANCIRNIKDKLGFTSSEQLDFSKPFASVQHENVLA